MKYEKPMITFQKFHIDSFLDDEEILSANSPIKDNEEFDEDGGFTEDAFGFNGTITINSDGVGGWFNG